MTRADLKTVSPSPSSSPSSPPLLPLPPRACEFSMAFARECVSEGETAVEEREELIELIGEGFGG